jgi:hypothetical protein
LGAARITAGQMAALHRLSLFLAELPMPAVPVRLTMHREIGTSDRIRAG